LATSRTAFRSFYGHSFSYTDKTTQLSTTKRCTHIAMTPGHLFQFVETISPSNNQTYSTFSHQIRQSQRAKIHYDTSTPIPDHPRLFNNPHYILQHLLHLSSPDFCAQKRTHHTRTTPFAPNTSPPKTFTTNTKMPPTSPDFDPRNGSRLYLTRETRYRRQKTKIHTATLSKHTKREIRV
jgi:hypothetical protein